MKIVASKDWRDDLAFESPTLVADIAPGEPARCAACGPDSDPLPRTELWAVKHRHPKQHSGYVRFYCAAHKPAVQRPAPAPAAATRPAARAPRAERAPRADRVPVRKPDLDVVRAMCPDCFVEVSATGVCGMCGQSV